MTHLYKRLNHILSHETIQVHEDNDIKSVILPTKIWIFIYINNFHITLLRIENVFQAMLSFYHTRIATTFKKEKHGYKYIHKNVHSKRYKSKNITRKRHKLITEGLVGNKPFEANNTNQIEGFTKECEF